MTKNLSGVDMIYQKFYTDVAGIIMEYYVSADKNITAKRKRLLNSQITKIDLSRYYYKRVSSTTVQYAESKEFTYFEGFTWGDIMNKTTGTWSKVIDKYYVNEYEVCLESKNVKRLVSNLNKQDFKMTCRPKQHIIKPQQKENCK